MKNFTNKLSPERYLMNKEYFDRGLIECLEHTTSLNERLRFEIDALKLKNTSLTTKLVQSDKQIAVLKCDVKDREEQVKKINDELDDLKKEIDDQTREIKRQSDEIDKQSEEINRQHDELVRLRKELEIYRRKYDKVRRSNSTNTNFPTSHYSFKENKAPVNSREKSDKKRGGQKGHKAHISNMRKADEVKCLTVKKAPAGAKAHIDDNGSIDYYYTQEVDGVFKAVVKETRYFISSDGDELDGCIMKTYRVNPLTYSSHLKALAVYLNIQGAIAYDRLGQMMNIMSDGMIDIKPSTFVKWEKELVKLTKEQRDEILKNILNGELIHVDETSMSVNGKNNWIHPMSNENGSYFVMTKSRSDKESGPLYILKDYEGTVIHDHFKPYYQLIKCVHAECNAHIDRYLRSGIDNYRSQECQDMLDLLHAAKKEKDELIATGITKMSDGRLEEIKAEYERIAKTAIETHKEKNPEMYEKGQNKYIPDYIKTFRRMREYREEHLRYLSDFDIPYTNNPAEKCARTVKKKKNISQYVYSIDTGNNYCSLLTLIETSRIKSENPLDVFTNAFESKNSSKGITTN